MSIRLRLALWYGMLFGLVLLVVLLFTYAFHARSHYDDLDQALVTSASHAAAEGGVTPTAYPFEASGGLEVVSVEVPRTELIRTASDHLPLVAEIRLR